MDTTPETKPTTKDLAALASKLRDALLEHPACGQAAVEEGRNSCFNLERMRPLSRAERQRGWAARPFYAFDPERMCRSCQAYLHAVNLCQALDDIVRGEAERAVEVTAAATGT